MDHLSSSQLTLYLLCGLKYKYQYIDQLPRPFQSSALAFGSAVHSTLAWLHSQDLQGKNVSLDMLYRIFDADWYTQTVDNTIKFKDSEKEMALPLLGKELLAQYAKEPRKAIKGAEVHFAVPLVDVATGEDLKLNLEGFFDLVEEDGTVVEFKTSASALSQADIDSRIQLTAYSYAFEVLYRTPPKGLRVVNFVKAKKPRIDVIETRRTKHDHRAFFYLAKEVLRGIRTEVFVPHPGYWCRDCEFADVCPLGNREKSDRAATKELEDAMTDQKRVKVIAPQSFTIN